MNPFYSEEAAQALADLKRYFFKLLCVKKILSWINTLLGGAK